MNELIQKLAEESGLDARTMGVTHTAQWNARVTKLAELIVLECSSICYKGLENGDEAASLLMNTFGVEE
jgi:hypothetical protein